MDGIERLKKMLEGQKDKYLNIIVNYLMQHTEMNAAFLNKTKDLKKMAEYIKGKAKKEASGGVAVIEDEKVFKWAEDYFLKTDEELGIKKKETTTKKIENQNVEDKENSVDDEFGSIFDIEDDSEEIEDKKEVEQISLFGM